jgi:hypothetical protein
MEGRILNAKFTLPDDHSQVIEYEGLIDFQAAEANQPAVKLHFVGGNAKAPDWGLPLGAYALRDELRKLAEPSPSQAVPYPTAARAAGPNGKPSALKRSAASPAKEVTEAKIPIDGVYYGQTDILVNGNEHKLCQSVLEFNSKANSATLTVKYPVADLVSRITVTPMEKCFMGEVKAGSPD